MEKVLTTEYLNDRVLDLLSPYDLNNLRACSTTLQDTISRYSNEKMEYNCNIVTRKIPRLPTYDIIHVFSMNPGTSKSIHIYDMIYNIIYNYYHRTIKYRCMVLDKHLSPVFNQLMNTIHNKKRVLFGHTFSLDTDAYRKNLPEKRSFTLFDIMTNIYLENKGNFLVGKSSENNNMDQIKFLQGTLLPL